MQISKHSSIMPNVNTVDRKQPMSISPDMAAKASKTPVEDEYISSAPTLEHETKVTEAENVKRLIELLKGDKDFTSDKNREFFSYPSGRALANAIILSDEKLQEEIAKKMWADTAKANKAGKDDIFYKPLPLPPSYKDYNIKAMLSGPNASQVYYAYDGVLVKKAWTEGLSDTEKLLSARLERIDLVAQGTFNERMKPVQESIEEGFEQLGLKFDSSKSYSFSLDTSNFKFSVSGGTDRENALIAQIINTSNYMLDNFSKTLSALYGHRRDDGKYNSWMLDDVHFRDENISRHGTASASQAYTKKMQQLRPAYEWYHLDQSLKMKYGFGIDDIQYQGGKVVGKNDRVKKLIAQDQVNFEKFYGDAYVSLTQRYTGTPEFTNTLFTLENGAFHALYG